MRLEVSATCGVRHGPERQLVLYTWNKRDIGVARATL